MSSTISRRQKLGLLAGAACFGLAAPAVQTMAQSPAAKARLEGMIFTRWRADPWSHGAYSFLAKGSNPGHRRDLRRAVNNRLFFAGEATSSNFPSTVHGALISGRDAARDVYDNGPEGDSVAVIGAGFSGLGAAKALADRGYDVTVFEARNRLGGRVNTDRSLGLPLDLGASWIHGTEGNPLTSLSRQLGVALVETDYEDGILRSEGGRAKRIFDGPQWLDNAALEYGADLDTLALGARMEGEAFGGEHAIFPGGYDQLLRGLKADYRTRLGTPVSLVEHNNSGVRLANQSGDLGKFDAVVVTIPLGALKAGIIAFSPALPAKKAQAINKLGMGLLSKVYLKYDQPFWDRDQTIILSDHKRNEFNYWLNMWPLVGAPVLCGFNGGSHGDALERQSDEAVKARALNVLSQMYPA